MNRRSQAKLSAALRLVPEADTIGIPIFLAGNGMFVAEMDADFRITRFLDFFNEEGYQLDYQLPEQFQGRTFSIGMPTPLPFWFQKAIHVVEGDAEREDVARRFGAVAKTNDVLNDLSSLLDDARNGRFRQRKERWTADEIAAGFGDVFYEPPYHSKYWVSRYNVAVANARRLTQPPHPIDVKLRRVALEWMKRFSTKTDFLRLVSMLGKPEHGIITARRQQDILFAFLVNKMAVGSFRDVEKYVDHSLVEEHFPFGLDYYFERNGWPKVPFKYTHPRLLVEVLENEIRGAVHTRNFERAAKMTFLLYRRLRVPRSIDDLVMPLMSYHADAFWEMRQKADSRFADREYADDWHKTAHALLEQYEKLMLLDGILNGDARLSTTIVDRRFGVESRYINELRKYAKRS